MSKPHFHMTDKEIRNRWRMRGIPDRAMVRCLSELNAVEFPVMVEKLLDLGLISSTEFAKYRTSASWTEQELNVIEYMIRNNASMKSIQERLGRSMFSIINKVHEIKERMRSNG